MKKLMIIAVSLLMSAGIAFAANTNTLKIATVNLEKVMKQSNELKKEATGFKRGVKKYRRNVKAAQNALQAKYKLLKAKGAKMKNLEKGKLLDEINKERKALIIIVRKNEAKANKLRQKFIKKTLKEINNAVAIIAKKQGYTLVISKTSALYSNARYDITSQVVKKIDS